MASGFGAVAGGIGTGAAAGSAIGGPIGGAIGGIVGGIAGLFGGSPPPAESIKAGQPGTNVLGASFGQGQLGQDQQNQIIANAVLQAHPELGTAQNALGWYASASRSAALAPGANKDDHQILAVIQQQLSTAQNNNSSVNMGNATQNQAVFGQQGANFVNANPNSFVQQAGPQAVQQATQFGNNYSPLVASLMGQAGIGPVSPEQQAQMNAQNAAYTNQYMTPALQAIASQQATGERNNQAHGFGYDPNANRQAADNAANAGQNAGNQVALLNAQQRQTALSQLGTTLGQAQSAQFQPTTAQNSIGMQQAAIGQQQAQLGLQGFTNAGNIALGQGNQNVSMYNTQQTGQNSMNLQTQQQGFDAGNAAINALGAAGAAAGTQGGGGLLGQLGINPFSGTSKSASSSNANVNVDNTNNASPTGNGQKQQELE